MAYIGLFGMVMAKKSGNSYMEGFQLEKAVSLSLTPEYEETSEYSDINDLEYKKELQYASVEIRMTDKTDEIVGKEGDDIVFMESDPSELYGLGFIRQKSSGSYETVWLYNVTLWEMAEDPETRKESIEYETPGYEGRAFPDDYGRWKRVCRFETKEQAVDFVREMANM